MTIETSVCRFENLFLPDIGYSRISAVVTHPNSHYVFTTFDVSICRIFHVLLVL